VQRLGREKEMRRSLWLAGVTCLAFLQQVAFAQKNSFFDDPGRADLASMGKPGAAVALAREKVTEILQSENSCSAWFKKADPNAAATFESLRFAIDSKGPQYIVGWRNDSGVVVFKHPYSASALEGTGAHSLVTLNANGPFFVRWGIVLWEENSGAFRHAIGSRILNVGSYPGNTLAAQITTMLHEFGHVTGRLPDDSDELSGQSGRNTEQVIHYCHAQIKAAERHAGRSGP
jgi:hypothetical protein